MEGKLAYSGQDVVSDEAEDGEMALSLNRSRGMIGQCVLPELPRVHDYSTMRSARSALLRRSTLSGVTATMSSMRTPKRPCR